MEQDIRANQNNGCDEKKNNPCIINIFCNDKKQDAVYTADKKKDGHCIINIFCNELQQDFNDHNEKDAHCIINIFCNEKHENKHDDKCNCEKGW